MSDYNEITAVITTEEPEIAVSLDELRYLVFEGQKGDKGDPGTDGHSPTVQVTNIPGGNRVTITDKNGPKEFEVDDGISPSVIVADITGGHRVTITDKTHPSGQTFDVMDGEDGGSGDFVLLHADDERRVFNGTTPITGAQIYALAETGKAVFLWDEDGEYLYAFDTVHNGDVYFFMPAFDGNGFYATVVNENDNECSFSARPAIPRASAEDAGKVLTVDSNGAWTKQTPSGSPDAVLYTPQSLSDSQKAQARTNVGAGTYSKPSGGIPASDLASGVIPTVPQMATQAGMSDWTSGKTVDAAALKKGFQFALQQLDGKASQDQFDAIGLRVDDLDIDVQALQNAGYQTAQDVQTAIADKADKTEIPTKVSELTNDSGFVTAQQAAAAAPVQSVNGMTGAVTIPTGSSDAVLYTPQSLTPAQQEQARKNISAPAKTVFSSLLVPILRECLYGTDQSDALDTLEAALSDQVETFTIQNVLTNVTTSNSAAMIISGAAYHAVLTPDSGTEMSAVTVTMGGVDITATAYANGIVSISSVTGDVVITAAAQSVIDTVTPELIDGYISPTTGTIGGTSSYRHTAVIPVREGDKVYGVCDDSQSGATVNGIPARWTAVYDNNGTFLKDSGVSTQSNYKSTAPYIVPSGVYGVVFSLTNRYANNVVVTIDKSERVVS